MMDGWVDEWMHTYARNRAHACMHIMITRMHIMNAYACTPYGWMDVFSAPGKIYEVLIVTG